MVTRREFVVGVLGSGVVLVVRGGAADCAVVPKDAPTRPEEGRTYIYVAQSGNTMGALLATELFRHQAHFEKLRARHSCFLRLMYHSTNRYLVPYALDVVEYFFQDHDLSFVASLGPRVNGLGGWRSDLTRTQGMERRLLHLIEVGLAARQESQSGSAIRAYIDIASPGLETRKDLKKYVLAQMPALTYLPAKMKFPLQTLPRHVPRVGGHSREAPDNTAEVASFLTGYVGSLPNPSSCDARGEIRTALAASLRAGGDTLVHLENNPKFKVLGAVPKR
jgi:hypothetical protein